MTDDYDLVVLGGGSAGYAAASEGAAQGLKVAVVDGSESLGGLCVLRGCMPSKGLIETANRMRDLGEAKHFAIQVPEGATVEMGALQERRRKLVDEFQDYRLEQLQEGDFELIRATGRFTGKHEILLDTPSEQKITFKTAIVATGSKPRIPKLAGLSEVPFWTSNEALEAEKLPEHLIVIGGGTIGCELGHCFEGLGSKVTIVNRSEGLLNGWPKEVGKTLREASLERGIELKLGNSAKEVSYHEGQFQLQIEGDNGEELVSGDALLVATGRVPNIEGIGLEEAGVVFDQKGIEVSPQCQTSQRHIFAVGDSKKGPAIVHHAVIEGGQAAKNAAAVLNEKSLMAADTNPVVTAVFSHPEVIHMGPSAEELAPRDDLETRFFELPEMGKAIIRGLRHGFVKVYLEIGSGKIVAATGVGAGVIDFSHSMVVAIRQGMTMAEFLKVPHYHPTLAEVWTYLE